MVLQGDFRRSWPPARRSRPGIWASPAAAICARHPDLRLTSAHRRPRSSLIFLMSAAHLAGGEEETLDTSRVALAEAEVVQHHRGDHAGRAVGRCRHHPAEARVLFVHRQCEAAHPGEHLLECWTTVPDRLDPGLDVRRGRSRASRCSESAARRTTPSPPGRGPRVWHPRKTQSFIAVQIELQVPMDLLRRAPDQLISPDDVRHAHAVGGAVVQQVVGRIDREWERHRGPP